MLLPAVQTMFDCPDENHTSPTNTPSNVIDSCRSLKTLRLRSSAEASRGSSRTIQSPFWSTRVVFFWPANSTVTCVPGKSKPHTGTSTCRCKIIFLVNATATSSVSAAVAVAVIESTAAKDNTRHRKRALIFLIGIINIICKKYAKPILTGIPEWELAINVAETERTQQFQQSQQLVAPRKTLVDCPLTPAYHRRPRSQT